MIENRLVHRLESYWNLLRKEKTMPDFAQLNTSMISDIWDQCALFTVQHSAESAKPSIHFNAIGEKLLTIYSRDMLGRSMTASQTNFQGAAILKKAYDVIGNPTFLIDQGQFVSQNGKVVKYRSCLMPFSGKDSRVSHVVVGLSWREF